MKISVVSGILGDYTLDESLKYLSSLGVDQFELGVGGYPGKAHADALVLSKDKKAREELLDTFKRYNMGISALAVHGTPTRLRRKNSRPISRLRAFWLGSSASIGWSPFRAVPGRTPTPRNLPG